MADFTSRKIDEMEATFSGALRKARAELGVSSFGMAIEDFPPDFAGYPEHNHDHDGQEEVYVVLSGSGWMEVDGEEFAIDPETMVRVGPSAKRAVMVGPEGMRLLVLSGVPGKAYEPPGWTELGAPAPTAG